VTQGPSEEGQRPLEEQNTQEPPDPEISQRGGVGPQKEDTAAVLLVAATLVVVTIVLGLLGVNIPA
jgi:hypothetical protein